MSGPFAGLLVPVLTPFDAALSPDEARYVDLCERLLARGADGLAVFGTTSEGNSLSAGERKALLARLCRSGIPGDKLMPGIGACSLSETADLLDVSASTIKQEFAAAKAWLFRQLNKH